MRDDLLVNGLQFKDFGFRLNPIDTDKPAYDPNQQPKLSSIIVAKNQLY